MFLVRKVLVKAPKVLIRWGEGLAGAQMIVNSYLSYIIYPDKNYIFKIMRSKVWLGSRWWWATPISDTANTSTVCICSRLFSREMETQRNSFLTFTFSREMETSWNSFLAFTFSVYYILNSIPIVQYMLLCRWYRHVLRRKTENICWKKKLQKIGPWFRHWSQDVVGQKQA